MDMDKPQSESPFRPLGRRLKQMRERNSETLAEASGAVEIDVKELASFELGQSRPSEEILLLLISHFAIREDEAVRIWELAGYGMDKISAAHMSSAAPDTVGSMDGPVLFTDIADVIVNNYGVVMNFMQNAGPKGKPQVVARVGMSREHAKSLLKILQITLAQTEKNVPKMPKRLGTPDDTSKN